MRFRKLLQLQSSFKDLAIQPVRYRRPIDDFDEKVFNPADDIFAFGSMCYKIVTGSSPYAELEDEDAKLKFGQGVFPTTKNLSFGNIINDCWNGRFTTFKAVLDAISIQ